MSKEQKDFMLGKDEVFLTDKLIEKIVREKKWGDVQSLKQMREMGAKWNTKKNSIVFNDFL